MAYQNKKYDYLLSNLTLHQTQNNIISHSILSYPILSYPTLSNPMYQGLETHSELIVIIFRTRWAT